MYDQTIDFILHCFAQHTRKGYGDRFRGIVCLRSWQEFESVLNFYRAYGMSGEMVSGDFIHHMGIRWPDGERLDFVDVGHTGFYEHLRGRKFQFLCTVGCTPGAANALRPFLGRTQRNVPLIWLRDHECPVQSIAEMAQPVPVRDWSADV